MKYTKEERIEIGGKIVQAKISNIEAAHKYKISEETARRYVLSYETYAGIKHVTDRRRKKTQEKNSSIEPDYESMSKDELIREIMKLRINETRLKKAYEMKGAGAKTKDNTNTK